MKILQTLFFTSLVITSILFAQPGEKIYGDYTFSTQASESFSSDEIQYISHEMIGLMSENCNIFSATEKRDCNALSESKVSSKRKIVLTLLQSTSTNMYLGKDTLFTASITIFDKKGKIAIKTTSSLEFKESECDSVQRVKILKKLAILAYCKAKKEIRTMATKTVIEKRSKEYNGFFNVKIFHLQELKCSDFCEIVAEYKEIVR